MKTKNTYNVEEISEVKKQAIAAIRTLTDEQCLYIVSLLKERKDAENQPQIE